MRQIQDSNRAHRASRHGQTSSFSLLLLLVCPLLHPLNAPLVWAEDAPSTSADEQASAAQDAGSTEEGNSEAGAEDTKKKKAKLSAGIFYGWITDINLVQSTVTVKPIDQRIQRRHFYVDSKTRYRVDGKRKVFEDIYVGDKVAVRFFAEDRLSLAEEIFVVFGEFNPDDYKPKVRRGAGHGKSAAGAGGGGHH